MALGTLRRLSATFFFTIFFVGIQSLFIQDVRAHDVHYAPNNTYYNQQNHIYGSVDASPDVQKFVYSISQKLGMGNRHIPVKLRSAYGVEMMCSEAFVCDGILFLDEQWFNTLTVEQKTFLIGHELAHIREDHCCKKVQLPMGRRIVPFTDDYFAYEIELAKCRRAFEKEADLISARELKAAQGGVALVEHWIRRFGSNKPDPLDTHPTFAERKKYLRAELALQKIATGRVKKGAAKPSVSKPVTRTAQAKPRRSVA